MPKQATKYLVMGFGLGGNHGDGIDERGNPFSSSWYVKPEDFQRIIDSGHYDGKQLEGCILINKIPAIEADFSLPYAAPMVNVKLQDAETQRAADLFNNSIAGIAVSAIGEHMPGVALMAAKSIVDPTFVGLDTVSPVSLAQWWRQRGAVIGTVKAGKVIWESA